MLQTVYSGKAIEVEQTSINAMYLISFDTEDGLRGSTDLIMSETLAEALWGLVDPDNEANVAHNATIAARNELRDLYESEEARLSESGYYNEEN
jgi:hypothetical protein